MTPLSGVLVIRAWVEPDLQAPGLRVRIITPHDDGTELPESFTTSSVEEATAFVAEWLAAFTRAGADG